MPRLEQKLVQKQILAPQQILQASLLQLNTVNLEQKILDELESNPILEQVEPAEETLAGDGTPSEDGSSQEENAEDDLDWDRELDDYEPSYSRERPRSGDDRPIPERIDFIEGLVRQLDLFNLADWERAVAEEILWNLDENGYLSTDPVLIADRLDRSEAAIEPILNLVHHLDPPGVGARNLRECLLIQLEEDPASLAYRIVDRHFDDFANHRYEAILKQIDCSEAELSRAIQTITHLNPRPGEGRRLTKNETVIPDLTVLERDGRWVVFNNDQWVPDLQINSTYVEMLNQQDMAVDTHRYLADKLEAARWFIRAIQQRRRTMIKVMQAIIARQPDFFAGHVHRLRPMKLKDVAEDIGMDISTISRSTRGKYVDTPYGVFELKFFFSEGIQLEDGAEVSTHQIKILLNEIIDGEKKQRPYTDEELGRMLNAKGYPVARRTVAKYREQLKIPVARLRRQISS